MPTGACVFDLDDTLTCRGDKCSAGKIKAMHKTIERCVANDMAIEVNTARPRQPNMLWGVPATIAEKLKQHKAHVYYRPSNSRHSVAEQKLLHMYAIAKKWNIKKKKSLVLFDDRLDTCQHLQKNGVSAIHVKQRNGIGARECSVLKKTLRQMSSRA